MWGLVTFVCRFFFLPCSVVLAATNTCAWRKELKRGRKIDRPLSIGLFSKEGIDFTLICTISITREMLEQLLITAKRLFKSSMCFSSTGWLILSPFFFFCSENFSLEAEGKGGGAGKKKKPKKKRQQNSHVPAFKPVSVSTLTSAWISRHKAVFYSQGPQWQVKFRQIVRSGEHGPEKRDPAPALTPLCSPAVVTCHPAQRPAPPPPPPLRRPDPPRPHWLPPRCCRGRKARKRPGKAGKGQRRPEEARMAGEGRGMGFRQTHQPAQLPGTGAGWHGGHHRLVPHGWRGGGSSWPWGLGQAAGWRAAAEVRSGGPCPLACHHLLQ